MAKHAALEFDRKLQKLFRDRTHWLRACLRRPTPGKAPSFNRKKVEAAIAKLLALATECQLRRHAVDGIHDLYDLRKQWHVTSQKGFGLEAKRKAFIAWFAATSPHKNCVYVFWAKRKCRYIGRTLQGKNRPQSHFLKWWFPAVTRVDIYASRGARDVPKLECLATHRFKPRFSKIKPAARKRYSKCPICETHRLIRKEVKSIFRLR